jgi:putative membrane-bound dehydrogenase-like protein
MTVPDGFHVTLFAGEPDVVKPIAMTTDDRGRLWVVESHSYPNWLPAGKQGRDRILIFEDKKGSGHFDSCKVFLDQGTNLSGIAVGFDGVWLCATPYLLFIPVRPGEDKPAGPPQILLDGWSLQAKHNVFNSLTWGPDGWLYGCNGIMATSHLGRPGTPDSQRVPFNCGVWRFHPTRQTFEVFAWGTTNPWGLDFDDYGEIFITNCVIKHLFHVPQGAHFVRMYGQDLNPNCYGLMESCADHIHWAGGDWTTSRGGQGAHDEPGGGHAHAGALVYLGGSWPSVYRNHVLMCNIHGNRINQDVLQRSGSGYVAHHGLDFLKANDSWFRGLALQAAADGGVFVSDWNDTGECHNYDKIHAASGRIYKVTYGKPPVSSVDLSQLRDEQLVDLHAHSNEWLGRHARRLMQERAQTGKLARTVRPLLLQKLANTVEPTSQLRTLWTLHTIGGLDEKTLLGLLDNRGDSARSWAVRLLLDNGQPTESAANQLAQHARPEKSPQVRLALASGLQRLPLSQRWPIAEALAAHGEDAGDPNLPLMLWYGIEPLAPADPARAADLLSRSRLPLIRQHLARRLVSVSHGMDALVHLLSHSEGETQKDVLRGMSEALLGQRNVTPPQGWSAVSRQLAASKEAEVGEKAALLSVIFGDRDALASLRKKVTDTTASVPARQTALQSLVESRALDLLPLLRDLLADPALRGAALRGLSAYKDPGTPAMILRYYSSFTDAEKADAIATLASRPAYALALLEAMEKGTVARRDVSAFTARQLLSFKDPRVTERLNKVWGTIRTSDPNKAALLRRYLSLVPPDALKKADRSHGRAVFTQTCASCHTLFDAGGKIGPDLTGSQRTNPEYILSKVLDPNAVVAKDYQVWILTTTDGRTVSGILKSETDKTLTVQTQNEVLRLAKSDIEERHQTPASMMPEGQLTPLSDAEIRDLIAYLAGSHQVPLPPSPVSPPVGNDKKDRK